MKIYYLYRDEKQIGPFSKEELKKMGITKDEYVWYEGLDDWAGASDILDLADLFSDIQAPINSSDGTDYSSNASEKNSDNTQTENNNPNDNLSTQLDINSIADVEAHSYDFSIGQIIGAGWSILKKNFGGFVGFTVIFIIIMIGINLIPVIGQLISPFLQLSLLAGYSVVSLKIIKNQPVSMSDFYQGFNYLLSLLTVNFVMVICILIGYLLLIIPGIYLSIAYALVIPIIVDRSPGFWAAMEMSRKMISKHWFKTFGLLLVLGLINLLGAIPLLLGLFITMPLTQCVLTAAYAHMVGVKKIN